MIIFKMCWLLNVCAHSSHLTHLQTHTIFTRIYAPHDDVVASNVRVTHHYIVNSFLLFLIEHTLSSFTLLTYNSLGWRVVGGNDLEYSSRCASYGDWRGGYNSIGELCLWNDKAFIDQAVINVNDRLKLSDTFVNKSFGSLFADRWR